MFQVGEVAQRLGLNPQTLYFYERIGLIPPPQRTASGYRRFSEADVERLGFITRAKALGLSLEEIQEIVKLRDGQLLTCAVVHERLLKKLAAIDENIRQLQKLRDELSPLVQQCRTQIDLAQPGKACVVFDEQAP